jgi:hypothetical protein
MSQSTIGRMSTAPLLPGARLGQPYEGHDTAAVAGGLSKKVVEVTVGTVTNLATYTFLVQGRSGALRTITITADGAATATKIRDALIAAVENDSDALLRVDPFDSASDKLRLEGRSGGDDFTVSTSDAKLAVATILAASLGQDIPVGVGVCANATGNEPTLDCRLPEHVAPTVNLWTIAPTTPNNSDKLIVEVFGDVDGDGIIEKQEIEIAAGASVSASVGALVTALDALVGVSAVANGGNTAALLSGPSDGTKLEVKVKVVGSNGTAATSTETAAGAPARLARPFVGVSLRGAREADVTTQEPIYRAGDQLPVRRSGSCSVVVEPGVNPNPGDPVYLRTVTNGTKLVGQFTNAFEESKTVRLDERQARWCAGPRGTVGNTTVASLVVEAR